MRQDGQAALGEAGLFGLAEGLTAGKIKNALTSAFKIVKED
jgi:hypothetical protein